MNYTLIIIFIVLGVIVDALVFERWGWMKDTSSPKKVLLFSGFAVVSALIFFGLKWKITFLNKNGVSVCT